MISEIIIKSLISEAIKEASDIHLNNEPLFVNHRHFKVVSKNNKLANDSIMDESLDMEPEE